MPFNTRPSTPAQSIAVRALALVDALEPGGHGATIDAILEATTRCTSDERLALRWGRRALEAGDATLVLERLIPIWERGETGPQFDAVLALAAWAAGLEAQSEAILSADGHCDDKVWLQAVIAVVRDEAVSIGGLSHSALVWGLRGVLQSLANMGRTDLVHTFRAHAGRLGITALAEAIDNVPARAAPSRRLVAPLLEGVRPQFERDWDFDAPGAAFNFAWCVGRCVRAEETVLLVGAAGHSVERFVSHGRVVSVLPATGGRPGQVPCVVASSASLPLPPGRFDHVIAVVWLETEPDAVAALKEVRRVLVNGGTLHLFTFGGKGMDALPVRRSGAVTQASIEAARLELVFDSARDALGLETDASNPAVHWYEARKRTP